MALLHRGRLESWESDPSIADERSVYLHPTPNLEETFEVASDLDFYDENEEDCVGDSGEEIPKDRKSTRLNSSHRNTSRMPSSA